jgi:membrane protein
MLLSLVPALAVIVSLYGLFADPARMSEQLAPFISMLPAAAQDLVREQAARLLAQPASELSLKLVVGVALAGWSATAATKALFDALNVIYDEEEKRSFIKLNAVALAATFGMAILALCTLAVVAVIPVALARIPFGAEIERAIIWLRWPVLFAVTMLGLAALYRIGPSRRAAKAKWSLPGAALGAAIWMAASGAFSWYASSLGDYEASFGSLASVVVFMTWLWLSAAALLFGAEFAAEMEHQTARDTTLGASKPIGLRGANMADSVGAAQD